VTLQVRATDTGGNAALSNVITLTLTPDTAPPAVVENSVPAGGEVPINLGAIRLRFSEPMDPATLTADTVRLSGPGGPVIPTGVRYLGGGRLVVFELPTLAAGGHQLVLRAAAIRDRAGNPLGAGDVVADVQAVPFVRSTFDTGTEGWELAGDGKGLTHVAAGGNPGGHLNATDQGSGDTWYWSAPRKFHGDQSLAYGGVLSFDLRQPDPREEYRDDDVILEGGGLSLGYDMPGFPTAAWQRFEVPMLPLSVWRVRGTNQPVAEAAFRQVLANVTALRVRGEYLNGADTSDLDNVTLSFVPVGSLVFMDTFTGENGGAGEFNYTGFANWTVTRGAVDLQRQSDFGYGPGLFVDLDGSTDAAGRLESKAAFDLAPGVYELRFRLGHTDSSGQTNVMTVSFGGLFSEQFTRSNTTPGAFEEIVRRVTVTAPVSARLAFDHEGADFYGLTIDDVLLYRLP
jgi:hypothetical protein